MLQVQIVIADVRRAQILVHGEERDVRGRGHAGGAEDRNARPEANHPRVEDAQVWQRVGRRAARPAALEALQQEEILRRGIVIQTVRAAQDRLATARYVKREADTWREIV